MHLLRLPGVFAPISDSWMMADAIRREGLDASDRVLDVCTGSGVLALAAAESSSDVTAVDVSRRAVITVKINARRNGARVRARRGRLFESVAGERFDLVVSNPPYVPSTADDLPTSGRSRAWAAGCDGREVLDRLCDEVPAHLTPGGRVLLVHSSLIDEEATVARLHRAGLFHVSVIERHRGALGPLMLEQQRVGTIPADIEEEDIVLIRGVGPG